MNSRTLKGFLGAFAVLLVVSSLSAQGVVGGGGKKKAVVVNPTLTVQVSNAAVFDLYVDGGKVKGNSIQVVPGVHTVQVKARGFMDYQTQVQVASDTVVPVTLQQAMVNLGVNVSNVKGFVDIVIDGVSIKGNSISVLPGLHTVGVRAKGYMDYQTQVQVTGDMIVPVTLQQAMVNLGVNVTNVKGPMTISVDGAVLKGNSVAVLPGIHTVAVSAKGFQDYQSQVQIAADMVVSVALQPSTASFRVDIPSASRNSRRDKDKGPDSRGQVELWIDGQRVAELKGNVPAGQHTVTLVSGGMQAEMVFDFQSGRDYVISTQMMLNIQ